MSIQKCCATCINQNQNTGDCELADVAVSAYWREHNPASAIYEPTDCVYYEPKQEMGENDEDEIDLHEIAHPIYIP